MISQRHGEYLCAVVIFFNLFFRKPMTKIKNRVIIYNNL